MLCQVAQLIVLVLFHSFCIDVAASKYCGLTTNELAFIRSPQPSSSSSSPPPPYVWTLQRRSRRDERQVGLSSCHLFPRKYDSAFSSTMLMALLRPDWLRKASRVKQIRQQRNRAALESLSTYGSNEGVGNLYQCCNPSTINVDGLVEGRPSSGRSLKWNEQHLNVYLIIPETEYEAQDKTNIMGRLKHGEIVRSTSPQEGIWIEHDKGGWSPSVVDGMTRLVPIENSGDDIDAQ